MTSRLRHKRWSGGFAKLERNLSRPLLTLETLEKSRVVLWNTTLLFLQLRSSLTLFETGESAGEAEKKRHNVLLSR